jgi:Tfp pilus assembly protein PilN
MIKVNLNKTRADLTQATRVEYQTTVDNSFSVDSDGSPNAVGAGALLKFLVMGIGIVGLYGFESMNISNLNEQTATFRAQLSTLDQQIQTNEPLAAQAETRQKEILAIESRIEAIKVLAKERLREIKVIDYIQNVLPERIWLRNFEFKESTLRLEGGAIGDDDLKQFIENLEGKLYFKNVVLLQSIENKSATGTVKNFVLTSSLITKD